MQAEHMFVIPVLRRASQVDPWGLLAMREPVSKGREMAPEDGT